MASDRLWRLKLKYEHSRGRCDLCAWQGIVGDDLKLVPLRENEPLQREEQGIAYMLRCADPVSCRQRRAG